MDKLDKNSVWEVTIPTIGFLGMEEPMQLHFDKETIKLFVRIVVVWCTFLLFRPRMVKAWKVMFGDNDEARQRDVQARIAKLEEERDKATGGSAKKNFAVATASAGSSSTTPASAEKGGAKRRKA